MADSIAEVYVHIADNKCKGDTLASINILFKNSVEIKSAKIKRNTNGSIYFSLSYFRDAVMVQNTDELKELADICLNKFREKAKEINFNY